MERRLKDNVLWGVGWGLGFVLTTLLSDYVTYILYVGCKHLKSRRIIVQTEVEFQMQLLRENPCLHAYV